MHPVLKGFSTAYIEAQNLLPLLSEYANPHDFLSRLVKSGELIRLKNGFFLIAEKIEKSPAPFEQIANLLYGPSYISLEWALSFYGMIPEGVYVVTSVSTNRTKKITTPIGSFHYNYLSHARYAVGFEQKKTSEGNFLIATPEKALVDLIHFKSRGLKGRDLWIDLVEGRRIEEESLKNLDKKLVFEIAEQYHSQSASELANLLGTL